MLYSSGKMVAGTKKTQWKGNKNAKKLWGSQSDTKSGQLEQEAASHEKEEIISFVSRLEEMRRKMGKTAFALDRTNLVNQISTSAQICARIGCK
jgi:hypothetical protein